MNWSKFLKALVDVADKYFVIAGIAFLVFYILLRKRISWKKIQLRYPRGKDYVREILLSTISIVIFALPPLLLISNDAMRPHTTYYRHISQHGWWYFLGIFPLLFLMHDAYFYWMHRLIHDPRLFRLIHLAHHRSVNPSPWAAYAFHPLEAFLESQIFVIFLFTIPISGWHLLVFFVISLSYNVYGHLGYELYPASFSRHWLGKWVNTSVSHNLHHHYFKGNYGLYFLFWDRWMGTLRKDYDEAYREVTTRGKGVAVAVLVFLVGIVPVKGQVKADDILGLWLTHGDKPGRIQIFRNGDGYEGKIVWMQFPTENGRPRTDKNNPDESRRGQPVLGLHLLTGFHFDKDEWNGGQIYDPQSGKTYSCTLSLKDRNTLRVRGYVGISLFGRTEIWTRVGAVSGEESPMIKEAREAFLLITQNPDSAMGLAEKELAYAQRTGDQPLMAEAYATRGWAWLHKGSFEKTFPDLIESARIFRVLHDTLDEMHVYTNIGLAYSNHSEFARSAQYLLLADSLAQVLNDERTKAEVKRQMGILYREEQQYAKAIPYFRESMAMYLSLHDTIHFFGSVTSLCAVYLAMSQPDSSLALMQSCLPLAGALRRYEKAMLLEHYGDAYFSLARYDKAMESYDGAYRLFVVDHNRADMAYEAMNLGKTFTRLKNYGEAESYLLLSYRTNDSLKLTNYAHDAAEKLSDLFKSKGDWQQAYHWLAIGDDLQDSLDLTAEMEKTAQLQAKYETDKKEEEISLLKKDQELSRAIAQRNRLFLRGAVMVVVLLVLIGLLVINRNKSVHKVRRLIELEKMRNQIARDLHDDMGSALSSIHIISKVPVNPGGEEGKAHSEEQKASQRLLKIHEHSALMLENMSDIVWTINPANDTLERIVFKMREFAADILDPLNIEFELSQEGNFHHVRLGLQTRKDIYLIFKEAINNAAKYSGCSRVEMTIGAEEQLVRIAIRDNGAGFCRSELRGGNGLKNMEERVMQIGGKLTIDSMPGCGTKIVLAVRSHD